MPGVDRETPVAGARAHRQLDRRLERVHVDVERHQLVGDLRVGVLGRIAAQRGELLGQPAELAWRAGDVADLDVVGVERRGGREQLPAEPVGRRASRLARIDEEVGQELDLEVLQPGVVEDRPHLAQRPRPQLVLNVGVPQADTPETRLGGLGAAV